MKVCMFVLNNCKRDARVLKEARTLADAGHDVRIIAVLDKDTEPYEEKDGFRIFRVVWEPGYGGVLRAIKKIEYFTIGLIFRFPMWIYIRRKERSTPSSYRIEPSSTSVSTSTESEQKSLSDNPKDKQPSIWWRAYRWVLGCYRSFRWKFYRVLKLALRPFKTPLSLVDYYHRSWQILKDEPADIYHSHDLNTLPSGYMARRRTGGKLVYDSHELFTELHYIHHMERRIFRWLERYLIHRADAVIITNEFAANELSKRYGIDLPVVVRNCPPIAKQGDKYHNSSLRGDLNINDTVPIIVHVGIYSKSRGGQKLISATPILNHGVVVFLGWSAGKEEGELQDLVKQMKLDEKVFFVPPVAPEQVVGYISSAQVGVVLFRNVSLNHYYVTPNKLWECMSAGLPVVSSNFPALKSIVEGYHFGKTCNPEDPEDIAAAINWVLADKKRYNEMRRNALKAAKIFNWENESKKLLEVYRRLSNNADVRTA